MSRENKPWEIHQAQFLTSAVRRQGYPREAYPQVAFAGRSNVGKSSLLNSLVRRKRLAKTSSAPGLTQMINFFLIDGRYHYVDLPGYGYAKAPLEAQKKWHKMLEEYLVDNPNLKLLVLLLDVRRKPSPLDDQLVDFLEHNDISTQIVLTKCDKLKRGALHKAQKAIGAHYGFPPDFLPIATSALKGSGRDNVLQMLHEALNQTTPSTEAPSP